MALVLVRGKGEVLDERGEVESLLGENGIRYRRWEIPESAASLDPAKLDDARKSQLLDAFRKEIDADKKAHGYVTADVVALAPSNPKLDEICAKFDKEHTHDEDEVRLVVSGHGTFTVRGKNDEAIDITMGPGDYISVPRDRRHWFTLLADKSIVAVRLFQDTKGWTPRYAGTGTGETEIPAAELERAFGKGVVSLTGKKEKKGK